MCRSAGPLELVSVYGVKLIVAPTVTYSARTSVWAVDESLALSQPTLEETLEGGVLSITW